MPVYSDKNSARKYSEFLSSSQGQVFKRILFEVIFNALKDQPQAKILDAGCGNGWLCNELSRTHKNIQGCDAAEILINEAKAHFPEIPFTASNLEKPLPYSAGTFDIAIMNMSLQDIDNKLLALKNIALVLKPNGLILMTIPNPYYAYPVGEWKRTLLGFIFKGKPRLKLAKAYNLMGNKKTKMNWQYGISSHFTPLPEFFTAISGAGLEIKKITDVKTVTDSPDFNLQYQLYRFPLILALELTKKVS